MCNPIVLTFSAIWYQCPCDHKIISCIFFHGVGRIFIGDIPHLVLPFFDKQGSLASQFLPPSFKGIPLLFWITEDLYLVIFFSLGWLVYRAESVCKVVVQPFLLLLWGFMAPDSANHLLSEQLSQIPSPLVILNKKEYYSVTKNHKVAYFFSH